MNQAVRKPELEEFGNKLKELRKTKGESQKEAANGLELKQSTLSSYEVGDREPPITTLNGLAKYYGVTVDYLTGNSEHKTALHQELLNGNMINKMIIDKIVQLSIVEDENFLETILCGDGFKDLLSALKKYKSIPGELVQEIGEKIYSDDPLKSLKAAMSANDLKKILSKKLLDEAVEKMLIELDELSYREYKILDEFGHVDDEEV